MSTTPMSPDRGCAARPFADATSPAPLAQQEPPETLPGWRVVGGGSRATSDGILVIEAANGFETGLASLQSLRSACLMAQVRLSGPGRFIAKLRHTRSGAREANSYHLVSGSGDTGFLARHDQVLIQVRLPRQRWVAVEFGCRGPRLQLRIDGQVAGECSDDLLEEGYAFIGVCDGRVELRNLALHDLLAGAQGAPADRPCALDGWQVWGAGVHAASARGLTLDGHQGATARVTSSAAYNDVELEFELLLDAEAQFVAKLHLQHADDPCSDSYHLCATPTRCYVARNDHMLGSVKLAPRRWHKLCLRWIDQQLTLSINGREVLKAGDNLLQSGHCELAVGAGRADIRGLALRDLTGAVAGRLPASAVRGPSAPRFMPFTRVPRRNLLYHVWPVQNSNWRWNVERLLAHLDLFNGRRVIGIVHDGQSESPSEVRAAFAGHGCEFVELPNDRRGECLTFPLLLQRVATLDANDVSFYGHAKGVRHGPQVSTAVKRWTEALYDACLGQWPLVAEQLERCALTGAFRMLGRFRAHQYLGDWHYSGTFFWLRHAMVFDRPDYHVPQFYGGVEAWPGLHFGIEETGCLLLDRLRQLPYNDAFWRATGDHALARMRADGQRVAVPQDLQHPTPFEGHTWPRLEQIAQEFSWFLDRMVAARPRTVLTIGSMHGGVEWHLARRFRERGLDLHITAVDLGAREAMQQAFGDARSRWQQQVDCVIGDSTAESTRALLLCHYDAVFIDGDHGYRGARADYEFALTRTPRLIALHDIVDSMWHADARCCVSRLWSEIEASHDAEARRLGQWGGIGIISLK